MAQVNETKSTADTLTVNKSLTVTGTITGSLSGNASSASVAASVSDYNSTSEPIYIGFRGDSLTSCEYLAAYGTTSSGARCIKDISPSNVTVGSANYATSAGSATKATQDANGSDIAGTYVK